MNEELKNQLSLITFSWRNVRSIKFTS